MSDALYLLPDAALALVLARMRLVKLDRARPDLFIFLYAWLLYSLATLYSNAPTLHFAVWLFAAAPLARASLRVVGENSPRALLAFAFPLPAALGLRALGNAAAELAAGCIAASITGGIFLLASLATRHSPLVTDVILWRGAGAYFLLFGVVLPLPALLAPEFYPLLLLASAAVWLALAWFIRPTPDLLFNLEKLAIAGTSPGGLPSLISSGREPMVGSNPTPATSLLSSMAPLRDEQGIGRAGTVVVTVLPVRNPAKLRGARSRVGNPAGATNFSSQLNGGFE